MRMAFLVFTLLSVATPAFPCETVTLRGAPARTPSRLVRDAATIVHVRAERHIAADPSVGIDEFPDSWGDVVFTVLRVLKGRVQGDEVRVAGGLSEEDDFNDGAVPYTSIRRAGRRGPCIAAEYKLGGEYLLLLRPHRAKNQNMSPYVEMLMPTNEQVRGASDPWIAWVDREIARSRKR